MTLLAHLLTADLKRHRLLLLAWSAVVIGAAALKAVTPMLEPDEAVTTGTALLGTLIWLAQVLLAVLLVALVIQTHPVVGSTSFWMTRPIHPDTLLLTKILLLTAAVVALPVVSEVAVMAVYRVPAPQVAAAAVQLTLSLFFWLIAIGVLAALTQTLARFALACGGVLLTGIVAMAAAMAVALASMDDVTQQTRPVQIDDPTSGIVLLVLATASGAVLLVAQYRTRSRLRSIALGAASLVVAVLVSAAWPWPWLVPELEAPAWAALPGRPRMVGDADTVGAAERTAGPGRSRWRSVGARLRLDGMESGWSVQVALVEALLRVKGRGDLISSASFSAMVPAMSGDVDPVSEAARSVLGVKQLAASKPPWEGSTALMRVRESEFRRFAPAVGHYRGLFQVIPIKYEIEALLPLHAGAVHQREAYRVVVEKVEYELGAAVVEIRESAVFTPFDRRPQPQRMYYLRNRHESQAMEGFADARYVHWVPLPFSMGGTNSSSGFAAQRLSVEFMHRRGVPGPSFALDERWLNGAELAIVNATQAQAFDRTLEIAGFPLRLDDPGVPAPGRETGASH